MHDDVFANGYFIGLVIGIAAVAAVWFFMRDKSPSMEDAPSTITEDRKE